MPRPHPSHAILGAAERLFCRSGIRGVGVDAIVAESGVSSRTVYKHFRSKDALAAAALAQRDRAWLAALKATVRAAAPDPDARMLALFDALDVWFRGGDFHGCAFVTAAGEFPDPDHPIRRLARRHKRALYAFILALAYRSGRPDCEALARSLFLLVEGAIVAALVLDDPTAASEARMAASRLLSTHVAPGR